MSGTSTRQQATEHRPSADAPAPIGHRGLRHAALLTLCFVVPAAYAFAAAARAGIEGFPVGGTVALVAAAGVGSGLLGVDGRAPGVGGILARLVGAVVLAVGVRMTVPTPSVAFAEVQERGTYLISGSALVVFFLLLGGAAAGHLITTRVVTMALGRSTMDAARGDTQQLLTTAWGCGLALLVIAGLTHEVAGPVGQVLFAGGMLSAVVVMADLRGRIPPPGAARAPIVAAPRSVRRAGITLAALTAVIVTAIAFPLVPDTLRDGFGRPSEWLAGFDLDLEPQRAPYLGEGGFLDPERDERDEQARRFVRIPEFRQLVVPLWAQAVLVAAAILALLFVLRPERWTSTLRRLWAALRGSAWHDDSGDFDLLAPVDDDEQGRRDRAGRFRDAFERVRPRPRDPRQAIVHDYLRVERLLARDEDGRRPAETPLEHAGRLQAAERLPDATPLLELARLVSTARYGRQAPTTDASDRSRELHQQLDRDLRARG